MSGMWCEEWNQYLPENGTKHGIPSLIAHWAEPGLDYELNEAHVFAAHGKRVENVPKSVYVFVHESGCSCYEPSDAEVKVFLTEDEAQAEFIRFCRENWLRRK